MQTVLVVDDVAENLYYLVVLLKGSGYEVRTAINGAEALESACRNPPDLVVSDILMPVMDGYALCREWRADARLKGVPFIFYTATFTEPKDEALALSLGADRFVIKPQEPETLTAIISEVLEACGRGEPGAPAELCESEADLLKGYNDALFRKLEKKMGDLERANLELKQNLIEQRRLEEQLRQGQKLEALGRFSAGIAHDLNNILTVIFGFGAVIQLNMPNEDPQRKRLDQILAAADRATNLTRSLLTFSRKEEVKLQPLNLTECIANMEVFLCRILGEQTKLIMPLRQEPIPVAADGGHMEQVLMNLATNARDAMPNGGVFSITTDVIDIDELFIRTHGFGTQGRYALLVVADNGAGMDEETRRRVFEPFFTTRQVGKGTGLGLSIVYELIQQHKGMISVYSEPGQGTTFRMILPLMEGDLLPPDPVGLRHQTAPRGQETILVVDDEAAIREYLDLFLTSLGYQVLLAADGAEAIRLFQQGRRQVDLVLIDVVMPNMKGRQVADEIRRISGDVAIVFTSGYQYDLVHELDLLADGVQLLMKPLIPTEVAVKLRAVLDG